MFHFRKDHLKKKINEYNILYTVFKKIIVYFIYKF